MIIQLSHSTVCTNSLRKQFAQRVCTTLIKTHMNSALLPIALYLCFLLWVVYLIGGTLLYLCLILYNSITCGCASCSAHRKLLEGYVGSGPCATRHLLSTSCHHNIIHSGHTCLTCVPACNCHHVHGWAIYGVPGLTYDVIIQLKSYTSLLCVYSNSYMYGT